MSENALEREVRSPALAFIEARLEQPMLEACLTGPLRGFLGRPGKGLRARMVALAWELAGGRGEPPEELPLAIELLHAGSLIVDDIEDGSLERRGAPALHVVSGLPVALNAGNWLYFAALEIVGTLALNEARTLHGLRRTNTLLLRCHEGQALDVGTRVHTLAQRDVPRIARAIAERKTGGLTALGTTLAAICAGAPAPVELALERFGTSLGVALQLLDDVGGICSDERWDKGAEDLRGARTTAAWALASQALDATLYRFLRQLAARVERGAAAPAQLREELRPLIAESGRCAARRLLQDALRDLRRALRDPRGLRRAEAVVQALEESYE
jgi:geranylgeranyl pyrophosphate synthase